METARQVHTLGGCVLGVALAAMLCFLVACVTKHHIAEVLLKPVPVFALSALHLVNAALLSGRGATRGSVLSAVLAGAAYVCYGFGDALLAMKNVSASFYVGGFSFLTGHLCLTASSVASAHGLRGGKLLPLCAPWRKYLAALIAATTQACAIAVASLVGSVCSSASGFGAWFYLSIYTCSAVVGALFWQTTPSVAFAMLGAHIYQVSDICLFLHKFCWEIPHRQLVVMLTYWAGCLLVGVAPYRSALLA